MPTRPRAFLAAATRPAPARARESQVLLRLALRSRDELLASSGGGESGTVVDLQAELRQWRVSTLQANLAANCTKPGGECYGD